MEKLKAKIGILPFACSRFKGMGKETPKLYEERVQSRLEIIVCEIEKFAHITNPGQIYTKADVENAMDRFYADKTDLIFAFFLSWSEDFAWIRFLRDMYPIPIFFAHVVPDIHYKNTEDENSFIEYLSTGGLVGTLEGSGSVARFNRPMTEVACGRLPKIIEILKIFAAAAALRNDLRKKTFGLLAQYNEVMWSTYVDPFSFFSKIGPEIRFISVASLEDAVEKVSEDRISNCIKELTKKYESRDDVNMEHFKASVRASLAVEDIAKTIGLCTVVINDVDSVLYERIGLRPGFCPTNENDGDIVVVPEGDLGIGLAMYILKKLTNDHVNIIEPAYIENDDTVMVVHAGPNDYTDERGKTIIARDIRFARSKWKHAGAPFAWHVIFPGQKTLLHVSQGNNGQYKMVATLAEALSIPHQLASYTHGALKFPGKKPEQVFTALFREGVTQHYAIAPGNFLQELAQLAHLLQIDYLEV